jgi:hypothetical protein
MLKLVLFCLLAVAAAGPTVSKSRADIEQYKAALEKSIEGMIVYSKISRYTNGCFIFSKWNALSILV